MKVLSRQFSRVYDVLVIIFLVWASFGCAQNETKREMGDDKSKAKNERRFQLPEELVEASKDQSLCQSSKEFITTLEFLRDDPEFAVAPYNSTTVAEEVSSGCTDAAQRFISSYRLLRKAGVNISEAMTLSKSLAQRDNETFEVFSEIFMSLFSANGLDLDLSQSLKVARSLSIDFDGPAQDAFSDFQTIIKFCTSDKTLDLPTPLCAQLAQRIAAEGAHTGQKVAYHFIFAFNYLTAKGGADLPTSEALKLSEEIVRYHPAALSNFIPAYLYAISETGLGLDKKSALRFATKMASQSRKPTHVVPGAKPAFE